MTKVKPIGFQTMDGMICTASEFNSNNGWGFGGAYGTQYQFGKGIVMKIGTACYRHTGTSPFITVWQGDERLFNESGHGKKTKEAALALVRELLNNSKK